MKDKKRLLIVWSRYRAYNKSFFEDLLSSEEIIASIVFMRNYRNDEPASIKLLENKRVDVVGVDNVRVPNYNFKILYKVIITLWRKIRDSDTILTSTQAPLHSKLAFVISKIMKKNIIVVVEQWMDIKHKGLLHKIYSLSGIFILKNCNMVFVHGENQKKYIVNKGINPKFVQKLPFLSEDLSLKAINKVYEKSRIVNNDKKVILYFGRITPQKGLKDLIKAFFQASEVVEDITLLICGGPDPNWFDYEQSIEYEKECRALASASDNENIIFAGYVEATQKHLYYGIADLFVHPHTDLNDTFDGWGLVVNEAASMGLPIICTDRVGASLDLVKNGVNGYIVTSGDVSGLAYRIVEIMSNADKRHKFSLQSRSVFDNYHRPGDVLNKIIEAT